MKRLIIQICGATNTDFQRPPGCRRLNLCVIYSTGIGIHNRLPCFPRRRLNSASPPPPPFGPEDAGVCAARVGVKANLPSGGMVDGVTRLAPPPVLLLSLLSSDGGVIDDAPMRLMQADAGASTRARRRSVLLVGSEEETHKSPWVLGSDRNLPHFTPVMCVNTADGASCCCEY